MDGKHRVRGCLGDGWTVRKVWLEMPFTGLVRHDDDAQPALSPRFVSSPERLKRSRRTLICQHAILVFDIREMFLMFLVSTSALPF